MLLPFHLGNTAGEAIAVILDPATKETATPKDIFTQGQLPEFMVMGGSIDHTKFVQFMEAYYKWMGTENQVVYESFNLSNNRDIDYTIDSFIEHFYKQFMSEFPEVLHQSTDKRKLIKNIKDFYRLKGTEDSYKILFRILFNETVEFYYPSKDLMRLSDSKWEEPNVLKLTRLSSESDLYSMSGRKLFQKNDATGVVTAYGFVQEVSLYEEMGYSVAEVTLTDLYGTFEAEKYVNCELSTGTTIREYVYPTIKSVNVSAGGTGYAVTDIVTVSDSGTIGKAARLAISRVDSNGVIKSVEVKNGGINYRSTDTITASISSNNGSGAVIGVSGGGSIETRDGFYTNDDSLISSDGKIQDNHYWQDFSYVLKSSRNFLDYKENIKRIIHPAGTAVFGNILLELLGTVTGAETNTLKKFEIPLLGHYTSYLFGTHRNLRANGTGGSGGVDLYPTGYGYSAGEANTYASETGGVTHNPYLAGFGASGPLGGITHGAETNTLNRPQGEQFQIMGGATGFNSVSGGITEGYWIVYPHPNARGVTNMPISGIGDLVDLYITPPDGLELGTFHSGEIVRQINPYSPEATGYITYMLDLGNYKVIRVCNISGAFLMGSQEIAGQSAGFLLGASGGATGFINNIVTGVGDHDENTVFGHIKLEDFMFGIERT